MTLTAARFLIAGLLLYALERCQGFRPVYDRKDWPSFAVLGVFGIAVTYVVFYAGVSRTTATDTSLMFACEPILIALFAVIFLRERLLAVQWLGMVVGIAGIWVMAGQAGGNALAALGLAIESAVSIVGKRLAARYRGLTLCAAEMLIGAACLIPFAVWECVTHPPHFTRAGMLSAAYLTLVCSAFCYGVWYHLLAKYPISSMVAFILINPLFGPILGWAIRGESLRRESAIGGALVVTGLTLTSIVKYGQSRRMPAPAVVREVEG
jgi:drug/metabolite transporter (DMT)-like permease